MEKRLSIVCCYQDTDVVELTVGVWNGRFGGSTNLYTSHGELAKFASEIEGFPTSSADVREFVLGAFGSNSAGGGTRFKFDCSDLAGHGRLQVDMEAEAEYRPNWPEQSVRLLALCEAAAVDRFVLELLKLDETLVGSAVLQLAG